MALQVQAALLPSALSVPKKVTMRTQKSSALLNSVKNGFICVKFVHFEQVFDWIMCDD
jgi:hypothetical protein